MFLYFLGQGDIKELQVLKIQALKRVESRKTYRDHERQSAGSLLREASRLSTESGTSSRAQLQYHSKQLQLRVLGNPTARVWLRSSKCLRSHRHVQPNLRAIPSVGRSWRVKTWKISKGRGPKPKHSFYVENVGLEGWGKMRGSWWFMAMLEVLVTNNVHGWDWASGNELILHSSKFHGCNTRWPFLSSCDALPTWRWTKVRHLLASYANNRLLALITLQVGGFVCFLDFSSS